MKQDKNFKMSSKAKIILANIDDKNERVKWKKALISAELNDETRMMMLYDVTPSGKIPRKAKEKPDVV